MSELKNWDVYSSDEENKKDISNKEDEEDNEKINVTHDQRTTDYLNKYLPLAQNAFDVFLS